MTTTTSPKLDAEAIIVGTGFGGMGAAIQLKRMGIDSILMLDRNDDLGGTWHVNTFPGLAVDIPSTTYCYSFEPNPYWSRLYAPGAELKQYAEHVADKYDLRRLMRFNTNIKTATYDEVAQIWTLKPTKGKALKARYVVLATGFLSQPQRPNIEGIDSFAGKVVHTADWDHGYDMRGKRAAVIGTGATAVQVVPEIAPQVEQLDVYQRTPIWVVPKPDGDIPNSVQKMFARLPITQRSARVMSDNVLEGIMVNAVVNAKGSKLLNRAIQSMSKALMRRQVRDPETRRKLTPDYSFGCKRPAFSSNYLPTFNRDNVELITDSIQRIEPDGIITADGRKRKVDTLVLATGFSLWEENFPAFQIIGRDKKDLGAWWRNTHFQSYEGITMPGFPNMFSVPTPYSYNSLSFFTTIEAQMKHMERCLGEMQRRGLQNFEVTEEACTSFTEDMRRRVGDSIFVRGQCATSKSYYFNQHGEAVLLRPTSTASAMRQAGKFDLNSYAFS